MHARLDIDKPTVAEKIQMLVERNIGSNPTCGTRTSVEMPARSASQKNTEPTLWLEPDLRSKEAVFTAAVGRFFGLSPTKRTADLETVEALRDH